jgi:hypothetical protein
MKRPPRRSGRGADSKVVGWIDVSLLVEGAVFNESLVDPDHVMTADAPSVGEPSRTRKLLAESDVVQDPNNDPLRQISVTTIP